ncbi:hypothetical protein AXJ14_gp179 [Geobacillus virus E3]|uniref:hypothetical protein n=1 Tax=Geobacillus virus E3 TaxID=1572712 RepID=UPI0006718C0B|nr:hypothetical protein AXJ14_gp179 [Geobacillus virus E3]AJA41498.1 hypothetical protein E3_0179 [Geobacillus virus E3]
MESEQLWNMKYGKESKPTIIKCECGNKLICDKYENKCLCGRVYSMFGVLNLSKSGVNLYLE